MRSRKLPATAGSLLLAAILSISAAVALGRPDTAAAYEFLTSGRPTHDQAVATVQLIVWSLIALVVLAQVWAAARHSLGEAERARQRRFRARATLAMGLLVFWGGLMHHQAGTGSLCCADIPRAERLLH
ncbi:MAG: hypothetical protein ABR573_11805 [Candidatus Dormibacteria bacterium]